MTAPPVHDGVRRAARDVVPDVPLRPAPAAARGGGAGAGHLHRLFHDQGTSVARWVRERRLANCRRDLEDPALAQRGVQAIARRWGFEDPALQQDLQGQLRPASRRLPAARRLRLPLSALCANGWALCDKRLSSWCADAAYQQWRTGGTPSESHGRPPAAGAAVQDADPGADGGAGWSRAHPPGLRGPGRRGRARPRRRLQRRAQELLRLLHRHHQDRLRQPPHRAGRRVHLV